MSTGTGSGAASNTGSSRHADHLTNFCKANGLRPPLWQTVSDRRGGRTAWSVIANVQGQSFQASFWYEGHRMDQAKEDAAEMALQRLGQIPARGVPPTLFHPQRPPPPPPPLPNRPPQPPPSPPRVQQYRPHRQTPQRPSHQQGNYTGAFGN